jgi:hypothetical protein
MKKKLANLHLHSTKFNDNENVLPTKPQNPQS